MVKKACYTLLAAATAMFWGSSANAGITSFFPINDNPNVTITTGGAIIISETGAPDQNVEIQTTGFQIDTNRNRIGKDVPLPGGHHFGRTDRNGKVTFPGLAPAITVQEQDFKVFDYTQSIGDPAILSAAAYEGGAVVPLWEWLLQNGYTNSNAIIQPDFFSTDGSPMFVAVDLAKLGDFGALFTGSHNFGDTFTVGASDMLAGLPGELFSTTLPVLGSSGWEVTPVQNGTEVVYGAFHSTTGSVPEPATWTMMLLGFGTVGYAMRKRPSVRIPSVNYAFS